MTLPSLRLIRLHLDSRQIRRTLVALSAIAVILRAAQPVARDASLFAQVTLMLVAVAAAAVVAGSTRTPFGEPEHAASSSLAVLRLAHLAAVTGTATVTLAVAAYGARYGVSAAVILRNAVGLTGMALLTAALLGAHLAWTAPLAYVMYCGGQLDVCVSNLWTWPTQPATVQSAAIAAVLLGAGVTAVSVTGARDHRTDPS